MKKDFCRSTMISGTCYADAANNDDDSAVLYTIYCIQCAVIISNMSHISRSVCLSVGRSVGWLVGRSVGRSVGYCYCCFVVVLVNLRCVLLPILLWYVYQSSLPLLLFSLLFSSIFVCVLLLLLRYVYDSSRL